MEKNNFCSVQKDKFDAKKSSSKTISYIFYTTQKYQFSTKFGLWVQNIEQEFGARGCQCSLHFHFFENFKISLFYVFKIVALNM
jgi:hypothetical protein